MPHTVAMALRTLPRLLTALTAATLGSAVGLTTAGVMSLAPPSAAAAGVGSISATEDCAGRRTVSIVVTVPTYMTEVRAELLGDSGSRQSVPLKGDQAFPGEKVSVSFFWVDSTASVVVYWDLDGIGNLGRHEAKIPPTSRPSDCSTTTTAPATTVPVTTAPSTTAPTTTVPSTVPSTVPQTAPPAPTIPPSTAAPSTTVPQTAPSTSAPAPSSTAPTTTAPAPSSTDPSTTVPEVSPSSAPSITAPSSIPPSSIAPTSSVLRDAAVSRGAELAETGPNLGPWLMFGAGAVLGGLYLRAKFGRQDPRRVR